MAERSWKPIDLKTQVVALHHSGQSELLAPQPGSALRIDGFTIGAPLMHQAPPHGGEMHPDGDELLLLISGKLTIHLETTEGKRTVDLQAGQAFVVPRGVWHRVTLDEACQLLYVTPGPGGEHRPPRHASLAT